MKKPWWTDKLTELWNVNCDAEREWSKVVGVEKIRLKANMRAAQKVFDKQVNNAKRAYWQKNQEELMQLNSPDPKEFWKRIGKIDMAVERRTNIPWEVVNEEGLIVTYEREVLDKWKNDYFGLLNFNHHTDALDDPINVTTSIPAGIKNPITLEEISKALRHAKLGKAVGTDDIPTEALQNETAKHFLYVLFYNCYEHSIIPTTWLRNPETL